MKYADYITNLFEALSACRISKEAYDAGCMNADAFCDEDEGDEYEEKEYTSVTGGDYSASCPWDAPGMSARDFI